MLHSHLALRRMRLQADSHFEIGQIESNRIGGSSERVAIPREVGAEHRRLEALRACLKRHAQVGLLSYRACSARRGVSSSREEPAQTEEGAMRTLLSHPSLSGAACRSRYHLFFR